MDVSGTVAYKKLFRAKSMKVDGFELMQDKSFRSSLEHDIMTSAENDKPNFLNRIISLPNDKIFMIGGASDVQSSQTQKDTIEFVKDPETGKRNPVVRASMW